MKSNNFWCSSVAWISTHVLCGILFFGFALSSWPVEAADSSEETFNHIQALYDAGKFSEALPIAQQWTVANETTYGLENTNTADALVCLASIYTAMGDNGKALPIYDQILKIREKTLGPENSETTESLSILV